MLHRLPCLLSVVHLLIHQDHQDSSSKWKILPMIVMLVKSVPLTERSFLRIPLSLIMLTLNHVSITMSIIKHLPLLQILRLPRRVHLLRLQAVLSIFSNYNNTWKPNVQVTTLQSLMRIYSYRQLSLLFRHRFSFLLQTLLHLNT